MFGGERNFGRQAGAGARGRLLHDRVCLPACGACVCANSGRARAPMHARGVWSVHAAAAATAVAVRVRSVCVCCCGASRGFGGPDLAAVTTRREAGNGSSNKLNRGAFLLGGFVADFRC